LPAAKKISWKQYKAAPPSTWIQQPNITHL
jgi:hypothetical protein